MEKDNSNVSGNNSTPSGMLNFFLHLGQAKRTYRTGWVLRGVKEGESIADHMYRMSMMAFLAPSHLDRSKCIEMCLIHDLAESIVGDLTPEDKVSKEEKATMEMTAIDTLTNFISDNPNKQRFKDLYQEYSSKSSPEADFVKSLDLFDMFLQAYEYEQIQKVKLDEFFSQIPNYKFEPVVKKWIDELMELRNNNVNALPKDSNLNTILRFHLSNKNQQSYNHF